MVTIVRSYPTKLSRCGALGRPFLPCAGDVAGLTLSTIASYFLVNDRAGRAFVPLQPHQTPVPYRSETRCESDFPRGKEQPGPIVRQVEQTLRRRAGGVVVWPSSYHNGHSVEDKSIEDKRCDCETPRCRRDKGALLPLQCCLRHLTGYEHPGGNALFSPRSARR